VKHPILPRGNELGLPVLSGLLLTLSFPPFHLLFPPFVALVPYLVFVARSPNDRAGGVSVRRATFWMGIVFYGTLLYWMFVALVYYTWLALLGYLITIVVLSVFLALAGWAVHFFRWRHSVPFWASLPIFFTAAECLRAHLGDLAFPWLGLGHSLTGYPFLVGFADVTGARGVTVWLLAINGLLAEWWLEGLRQRWRRWALPLVLLVALPVGYSLLRWTTLETRPAARVLVVQPNIPEELKLTREAALDTSRLALDRLTRPVLDKSDDVAGDRTAVLLRPCPRLDAMGVGAGATSPHGPPLRYARPPRVRGGRFRLLQRCLIPEQPGLAGRDLQETLLGPDRRAGAVHPGRLDARPEDQGAAGRIEATSGRRYLRLPALVRRFRSRH
jgi:hypothetical protein